MPLRLAVLSLPLIAATAAAQSPLVTPAFCAAGSSSYSIYFDLTVHTDVSIDMIEMNFQNGNGTNSGLVEVYTRPVSAVGFQRSSVGWTLVGSATAVGRGQDIPSPVDFAASAMGSIALAPGSYGVAISAALGHRWSASNGTNNMASTHEISLVGGTALWTLWNTSSTLYPAAPSMAFHYTVPPSWATTSHLGTGCVDRPSSFYEYFHPFYPTTTGFDLGAQPGMVKVLPMAWTGTGYAVSPPVESVLSPGANWVTPVTPDLAMGINDLRTLTLGFGLPWEGDPSGAATTSVRLSSNGFLALTNNCMGSTSSCSSAWAGLANLLGSAFGSGGVGADARLFFFFSDLVPTAAGTIHFETSANNPAVPPGEAYVTFLGVASCQSCGNTVTAQVKLCATGDVEYRYQQTTAGRCFVGYSPGASLDPNGARYVPSTDLSALTSPLLTGPDLRGLSLRTDARPVLGTTFNLVLGDVPTGATFGVAAVSFATQPGLALDSIGMETCALHIGSGLGLGTFVYGFGPTSFPLTLPPDPGLAGIRLAFQGACNGGVTSSGLLASNAYVLFPQSM